MNDVYAREQRLRKQAELKSLYTNLASLRRDRGEAGYIEASAIIPERLVNQINELRQDILRVERELAALGDEAVEAPGSRFYREAFETELAGDTRKALNLYKSASRHTHPDANAALRSLRYRMAKKPASGHLWQADGQAHSRLWLGLGAGLIMMLVLIMVLGRSLTSPSLPIVAVGTTATSTATQVILIIPHTATPTPTETPVSTATPAPTKTSTPIATPEPPTVTPTRISALRSAPKIIGPKDGLVWQDGAIVFEFEDLHLAYNELYCLNSMQGYDKTNTENWSHPPVGRKEPSIPVEANVFRIAKQLGIRCVVWTASIGVDSCDRIISENTSRRIIGLPQVCDFNK
jgi:hypothetical protein